MVIVTVMAEGFDNWNTNRQHNTSDNNDDNGNCSNKCNGIDGNNNHDSTIVSIRKIIMVLAIQTIVVLTFS